MRRALRSTWAARTLPLASLLQRNPPAAHTPCRVLASLRRPAAALRTAAAPHPKQINSLISKATSARELLGLHAKYGKAFDSIHLSTCWNMLGRMNTSDRRWLRNDDSAQLLMLREQTRDRVQKYDAQAVSNTAHALAKLDLRGTAWGSLWEDLAELALASRREFKPQHLANTAWAFATAGHAAPALFDAIGREAAGRVRELNPQNLANTAWAFATAGHAAPALFDAIGKEAAGRVREPTPQGLANTAWEFATAGHAAPALFDAIGKESAGRVRELNQQDLANTAWAFATAGHTAPALFDAIGREAAGRVHELNPQDLSNTAWAFATAGQAAPALFDAIGREAAGRVHELNPQGLANTAWAFATAGQAAPALFDAIGREAAGRVRELNSQDLANTAWAFAVLDHLPLELSLFDQRFAHQCDALAHEFNSLDLSQLHQWRLWYTSERACSDRLPSAALLARCDAAFRAAEAQPSRLQRDVAKAPASLGASVQEEKVLEEGYSLDLVVDCGGEELIAIEVDGPSHFVGREPTASTLLKRRQLRHFGWRLVSVPYWEWDELNHSDRLRQREQRAAYLSSLLSEATGS